MGAMAPAQIDPVSYLELRAIAAIVFNHPNGLHTRLQLRKRKHTGEMAVRGIAAVKDCGLGTDAHKAVKNLDFELAWPWSIEYVLSEFDLSGRREYDSPRGFRAYSQCSRSRPGAAGSGLCIGAVR